MEIKRLNVEKIIRDTGKKRQEEIIDLESRSKPLRELVVIENFTVNEITGKSYATSFPPPSGMFFSRISPAYEGGFISRLVLKVSPDNPDIPIRTINFDGFSTVVAGNHIFAKIPKYEEKKISSDFHFHSGHYSESRIFHLDRDFNPEESAIELAILAEDGTVLRKDRAINYKIFV